MSKTLKDTVKELRELFPEITNLSLQSYPLFVRVPG